MEKFTFRLDNRMKLVFERPSKAMCQVIVSGKNDTEFRFSKRRVDEFIDCFKRTSTFSCPNCFEFNKTAKSVHGMMCISSNDGETFTLYIVTLPLRDEVLSVDISHKTLKKMIKVIQEVFA